MDIRIYPGKLTGIIQAIPSKSQAHRLLICAAFADGQTEIVCPQTNEDIEATAACLRALGAQITRTEDGYLVIPVSKIPETAVMHCRESGSTLRFMLPIAGALGIETTFYMSGRLSKRPLSPLWEEMERMGCSLTRPTEDTITCTGKLRNGTYEIDGGVSSQFITGLLFAFSLMSGSSRLNITGKIESKPYITMTLQALAAFGVKCSPESIHGAFPFHSPNRLIVEGDWSNGAFFLAASTLGNSVSVSGLNAESAQGDRAVAAIIEDMANHISVSAADIPDLIPILSVVAAANHGAVFTKIERLRLKESDRVESTIAMLRNLGIHAEATHDTLTVYPGSFHGGTVDSVNDHRIAMSAAIAATLADSPVTILDAHCVAKSYPTFWDEYRKLGGNYEQYIR